MLWFLLRRSRESVAEFTEQAILLPVSVQFLSPRSG